MNKIERIEIKILEKETMLIKNFFNTFSIASANELNSLSYERYLSDGKSKVRATLTPSLSAEDILVIIEVIRDSSVLSYNSYRVKEYCNLFNLYNEEFKINKDNYNFYVCIKAVFISKTKTAKHQKKCIDKTKLLLKSRLYETRLSDLFIYYNFKNNYNLIKLFYFLMSNPSYILESNDISNKILLKMNYYGYCDSYTNDEITSSGFYNLILTFIPNDIETTINIITNIIEIVCKCSKNTIEKNEINRLLKIKEFSRFKNDVYDKFIEFL